MQTILLITCYPYASRLRLDETSIVYVAGCLNYGSGFHAARIAEVNCCVLEKICETILYDFITYRGEAPDSYS